MTGPRVAAPIFPLYGAIITEPRVGLLGRPNLMVPLRMLTPPLNKLVSIYSSCVSIT